MRYYELHVPRWSNSNQSYHVQIAAFEQWLLDKLGGYHRLPAVKGAWRDKGKDYVESMVPFHVACEPEVFAEVLAIAFRLFSDQYAIFTAEIGSATIHERERQ